MTSVKYSNREWQLWNIPIGSDNCEISQENVIDGCGAGRCWSSIIRWQNYSTNSKIYMRIWFSGKLGPRLKIGMSEAYNAGNLWNYGSTSMYSIYLFLHIAIIYCTEWVLFTKKVEGYDLWADFKKSAWFM